MEDILSKTYAWGVEHEAPPEMLERYWNQVQAWTERYLKGLADLRQSSNEEEYQAAILTLRPLCREGSQLDDDFRLALRNHHNNEVSRLEAQLEEMEREQEEFRKNHPVQHFLVHCIMFKIFDAADWLVEKATGRGICERMVRREENQKVS